MTMSPSSSPPVQRTISPVDGSVVAERELATPARIDGVLDRATAAQRAWRTTPLADRVAVVQRLVPWMVDRADAIGAELSWQMGRPVAHAPVRDHPRLRGAGHVVGVGRRRRPGRHPGRCGRRPAALHPPRPGRRRAGRRAVELPLPLLGQRRRARAAGRRRGGAQGRVADPAGRRALAEGLAAAGLPEGVFQFVARRPRRRRPHGGRPPRRASWRSRDRWQVATPCSGRPPSGSWRPASSWAARTPPTSVPTPRSRRRWPSSSTACSSTPVSRAARSSASTSTATVFDPFVDAFAAGAASYRLGDPLDPATTLGPLVRSQAAAFVRDQVDEAVAAGARPLVDPGPFPADDRRVALPGAAGAGRRRPRHADHDRGDVRPRRRGHAGRRRRRGGRADERQRLRPHGVDLDHRRRRRRRHRRPGRHRHRGTSTGATTSTPRWRGPG